MGCGRDKQAVEGIENSSHGRLSEAWHRAAVTEETLWTDVTGAWRWVGTQKVGRRTVCETTGEVLIFALGGGVDWWSGVLDGC